MAVLQQYTTKSRYLPVLYAVTILLFLAAASPFAIPQEQPPVLSLIIKDISSNRLLSSIPAVVRAKNLNTGFEDDLTQFLSSDGSLSYQISPGNWEIEVKILNNETSEIDYYAERHFNIQEGDRTIVRTFYVIPVGFLEGVVVDDKGHLVDGAALEFTCNSEKVHEYPSRTDQFGSFRSVVAPTGSCRVFASHGGKVGVVDVDVLKGSSSSVKIVLDHPSTSSPIGFAGYLVGVVIILVVGLLLFFTVRQKMKKSLEKELSMVKQALEKNITQKIHETSKSAETSKHGGEAKPLHLADAGQELNPRARDIIKTLNERETKIIEALFQHHHVASQAALRHTTSIPKTSLIRSLAALEAKQVVSLEKIGKMRKVTLTSWFLGKD